MTETENRNSFLKLGRTYLSQQRFEFALQNFNKCLEQDPEYLKTNILVAFTQYKLKDYDKLYESYKKCLEIEKIINENNIKLIQSHQLDDRSHQYTSHQDHKLKQSIFINKRDVKNLFQKIASQDSSIYKHFFNKGQQYLKDNKIQQAICEFHKCTEINPKDFIGFFYLAHCQALDNQNIKAIENYKKSLDCQKYNFESYLMIGILYFRLGQQKKAIKYYKYGQQLQQLKKNQKIQFNNLKYSIYQLVHNSIVTKKFKNNCLVKDDLIEFQSYKK